MASLLFNWEIKPNDMTPIKNKPNQKNTAKYKFVFVVLGLMVFMFSCKKENSISTPTTPITPIKTDSTIAPASFDFRTTKSVSINISLQANNGDPIAGVPVNIFENSPSATEPLLTAVSDANGMLRAQVELPAYVDTLVVDAKYVGLMRNAKAVISNAAVTGTIGGSNGFGGNIIESVRNVNSIARFQALNSMNPFAAAATTTYTYMGPYDSSGVPKDLVPAFRPY